MGPWVFEPRSTHSVGAYGYRESTGCVTLLLINAVTSLTSRPTHFQLLFFSAHLTLLERALAVDVCLSVKRVHPDKTK